MKKVITGLEESLDIKTKESEHLQSLVTKMEATPGQDEMNKVQITDLKTQRHLCHKTTVECTEVCFASFLSGGFTTMAVLNPPERKLTKCTSVQ